MENYYLSTPLKLAIFALLLLSISAARMQGGGEEQGVWSDGGRMREAMAELVAKEKAAEVVVKEYERVFEEATTKRGGEESVIIEQKLKCQASGKPCTRYWNCCSEDCYNGVCIN